MAAIFHEAGPLAGTRFLSCEDAMNGPAGPVYKLVEELKAEAARLRAVRLIPLAKSMYPEPFMRRIFSTNVFSLWLLCAWRERGA